MTVRDRDGSSIHSTMKETPPIGADIPPNSTRARVISRLILNMQDLKAKVSSSRHVVGAVAEVEAALPVDAPRPAVRSLLREIIPAEDETTEPWTWTAQVVAGLFRCVVTAFCRAIENAVATRLRAGLGLILFVLVAVAVHFAH